MPNTIWDNIFSPPKEKRALLELLMGVPVFEALSRNELIQIERLLHVRHYARGDLVFNEGEPGAAMYILHKGEIAITKNVGENNTITLARIHDRSFFGEIALLDECPRSASAHAAHDSELLAFSRPDLEKLLERNPRLGAKIIANVSRLVCRRLIATNETLEKVQGRLNEIEKATPQQDVETHVIQ